MKYIVVSKDDLSLDVAKDYPESGFVVPVKLKAVNRKLSPLESTVYRKILHPAKYEEDKIVYPELERRGIYIGYKLIEPPPWMIAMAYIMWEGIIQGLTWDVVKPLVSSAIAKAASFGLAPRGEKLEKTTQVGFAWARYSTDEKKQRDMFIGLKRIHEEMSEDERRDITNSVIAENS